MAQPGSSPRNPIVPALSGHIPEGLNVVKVGTLDEAYDALVAIRDGKGGSLAAMLRQAMSDGGLLRRDIVKNTSRKVGNSTRS